MFLKEATSRALVEVLDVREPIHSPARTCAGATPAARIGRCRCAGPAAGRGGRGQSHR